MSRCNIMRVVPIRKVSVDQGSAKGSDSVPSVTSCQCTPVTRRCCRRDVQLARPRPVASPVLFEINRVPPRPVYRVCPDCRPLDKIAVICRGCLLLRMRIRSIRETRRLPSEQSYQHRLLSACHCQQDQR